MSDIRKFWPNTRLSKLAAKPGGMRVLEAVARADARLESVSATCLAGVDAKIDELIALSAEHGGGAEPEKVVGQVYRLSNEIFAESGVFGRVALSAAAQSLCDLTSAGTPRNDSIWNAIEVHVQSMRVLRRGDVESSSQMCHAVLEGLRTVSKRAANA
jgi:hypothetical protein